MKIRAIFQSSDDAQLALGRMRENNIETSDKKIYKLENIRGVEDVVYPAPVFFAYNLPLTSNAVPPLPIQIRPTTQGEEKLISDIESNEVVLEFNAPANEFDKLRNTIISLNGKIADRK